MNKDIWKYIANCVLCRQEKAKVQQYPLQMTEIHDRLFDKIAIDLVTDCETSTSGNKHILTIIESPNRMPRSLSYPWHICRYHSHHSYQSIFTSTHVPQIHSIWQWHRVQNGLMDQDLQLGIDRIFSAPNHPQSNCKMEVFHKYLKPTWKKLCKRDPANWDKYLNQVLASYRITPNLATAELPFF